MTAIIALAALAAMPSGAKAQSGSFIDYGNANVTVDLSVIEDGGYGPGQGIASPSLPVPGTSHRRLLMPGSGMPTSRLHLAVPGMAPSTAKPAARPAAVAPAKARPKPAPVARAQPAAAPPPLPKVKKPVAAPKPPKAAPKPKVTVSAPPPPPAAKPKPAPAVKKAPPPAPPPTVTAKKTPPAAPKPREQASRPPAQGDIAPGRALRLAFAESAPKISPAVQNQLKTLARQMREKSDLRLQLMAYAGGKALSSSKARRLSLSRALSVRAYLIENGIRSTRIDVRALGNKTTDEPVNRVDVMVVAR
ncbi:MAG: OmpA family protein [Rhodospirillales bacterium]|nr:OmpA family protein [Rhodospirillales bacterium]